MTYLPSLIKKIDDYHRLSEAFASLKKMGQGYYMPDEPEDEEPEAAPEGGSDIGLYPEVMATINSLSDESNDYKYDDIAHELSLIAELYKRAVEINGGFNQMKEYIKRTMANIDMMIDESDGRIGEDVRDIADETLENLSSDLRQRAKSSITQQMDEPQAAAILKSVKDDFNRQEAQQEMAEQKSVYERGKPGEETGHGISARAVPETPEKYAKQIETLKASLDAETDPNNKANIVELIQTLAALIKQMAATKSLEDEVKITPDDTEKKEEFIKAAELLNQLRAKRLTLKRKMNEFLLSKDEEKLEAQFAKSNNPKEMEWLQQQIDLLRVRKSNDLRKRDEIKARKAKINSWGVIDEHGDFQSLNVPETERIALDRAIQLGQEKKVSKADYDRSLTEQRAKIQGRVPAKRAPQRGGWAPYERQTSLDKSMFDPSYFPLLASKIGPGINTAVSGATYYIAREKEGGVVALKPFIEAVSKAIRSKDNVAKFRAIAKLREETSKYVLGKNKDAVASYEIALRLTPFFRKIDESVKVIASWQKDGQWPLDDAKKQFVKDTTVYIAKMVEIYQRQYGHKRSNFNSLATILLPKVKEYLEQIVLGESFNLGLRVEDKPEQQVRVAPEEEVEEMPEEQSDAKKRMRLMTRLIQHGIIKMRSSNVQ